jgi:hypothetical protein
MVEETNIVGRFTFRSLLYAFKFIDISSLLTSQLSNELVGAHLLICCCAVQL